MNIEGGNIFNNKIATFLKNKIQSNPQFVGENHIPLKTPNGIRLASYAGPGTHIEERIKKGIEPLTSTDKAAKAHDLRYLLAKNENDIRNADNKLIKATEKINNGKLPKDYKINTFAVRNAMKAKKFGEDIGVFGKDTFTKTGSNLNPEEEEFLKNELDKLAKLGYGINFNQYLFARDAFALMKPKDRKFFYFYSF